MSTTLTVAYADPPYMGKAKKHYKDHEDYDGEVDHEALIDRLVSEYPDGWALSCHMPSMGLILQMCEERGLSLYDGDIRIGSWCKTFGAFKRNVRVAYVWEPVIIKPAERLDGSVPTRDFAVDAGSVLLEPITMKRGLAGAKPERFAFWLFNILGLRPCDELHDLFPGSRAISESWEAWKELGGPKLKQSLRVTNELQVLS